MEKIIIFSSVFISENRKKNLKENKTEKKKLSKAKN